MIQKKITSRIEYVLGWVDLCQANGKLIIWDELSENREDDYIFGSVKPFSLFFLGF